MPGDGDGDGDSDGDGDGRGAEAVAGGGAHELHDGVAADRSGGDGDEGAAGGTEAAGSVPPGARGAGTTEGARPGDIAREALRAARDEAKRARTAGDVEGGAATGAGGRGAGAKRGARTRPDKGTTGGTRGRRDVASPANSEGASRAQELRELLAGAFQLPSDVSDPWIPSHPADERGDERAAGRALAHPEGEGDETTADAPRAAAGTFDHRTAEPGAQAPRTPIPPASRSATGGPVDSGAEQFGYRASEPRTPASLPPATPSPEPLRSDPPPASSGPRPTSSEEGRAADEAELDMASPHPEAQPAPHPASGSGRYPASGRGAQGNPAPAERLPRSMASPGRDGELRRTFPRFPARDTADGAFAETWWGNAWVTALEEGALDAGRLARGRTYAGQGHVDAITVTPGLVLAYVHGSRPRPYRVQIRVRTLADADWDRFLDAAAERPGHIAALLDKEMPKSLAECGVDLLPGPGELEPHCSCPDFGHPCKHAAALCYQTARLLDQDPFVLLLLRGRGERELLDALSRRNATRAARASQEREPAPLPGVRARDVLARGALPPLPVPLPPPAHPEQPPAYPGAPGGPDPFALDQLATDAAARAHALLTAGRDPVADLTLWQDAVRIAAARPGSGLTAGTRALYASLAKATRRTPADLARAVAAWRQGGFDALGVLEEPWDPPAGRFDRARPLLLAADLPAFRPWRNHLTHPGGHAQLRLGRNGLWYAFESEPGHDDWWPRGTPDLDPVGALTGLGAPGDL
ncbi:SWIM zinc finger family protein [Streptomyces sp. NPDC048512]|uniref:SWIM zinc finger family protein n=1 Tax=Streptomyces sp. NPDC048512 TaxID=3365563 RepID=UPI0037224BDE